MVLALMLSAKPLKHAPRYTAVGVCHFQIAASLWLAGSVRTIIRLRTRLGCAEVFDAQLCHERRIERRTQLRPSTRRGSQNAIAIIHRRARGRRAAQSGTRPNACSSCAPFTSPQQRRAAGSITRRSSSPKARANARKSPTSDSIATPYVEGRKTWEEILPGRSGAVRETRKPRRPSRRESP